MAPPPTGAPLNPWNFDNDLEILHPETGIHSGFHGRSKSPAAVRSIDSSSLNVQFHKPTCADPDPMIRYYNDSEHFWTPQQIPGHHYSQNSMEMPDASRNIHASNPNFSLHRGPSRSVISSTAGGQAVDSGYGTRSIVSGSVQSGDRQGITGDMHSFHVHPPDNGPYDTTSVVSQEPPYRSVNTASDVSSETNPRYPMKCDEPNCTKESKNRSEHKYVMSLRLGLENN